MLAIEKGTFLREHLIHILIFMVNSLAFRMPEFAVS